MAIIWGVVPRGVGVAEEANGVTGSSNDQGTGAEEREAAINRGTLDRDDGKGTSQGKDTSEVCREVHK